MWLDPLCLQSTTSDLYHTSVLLRNTHMNISQTPIQKPNVLITTLHSTDFQFVSSAIQGWLSLFNPQTWHTSGSFH